jgi:hypothetical protein
MTKQEILLIQIDSDLKDTIEDTRQGLLQDPDELTERLEYIKEKFNKIKEL